MYLNSMTKCSLGCELSIFTCTFEIRQSCLKNHRTFCLQPEQICQSQRTALAWHIPSESACHLHREKKTSCWELNLDICREVFPKGTQSSQGCYLNSMRKEVSRRALLGTSYEGPASSNTKNILQLR